jgi:PAS domain S-box-containing protein
LPQIVWITRPDGWHVHFNQRWLDFTGLTLEESLGHGWNPAFHPDDRARAAARWEQATSTGEPYEIEYRLRRHDGVYRWMLGRALPVRDDAGTIVRWVGTCTDIEEIKEARAALEHVQRLQHVAGAAARVGGWTIDVAANRVHWSPMMYEIHEHPRDEAVDLDEAKSHYLAESRARLDAALEACAADGTPFDLELQLRTYTGRVRWVRAIGEATRGRDLVVTHLYGALQDITRRKEASLANEELTARLTSTLEGMSDGFLAVDRDWRYVYVNQAAERILDRSRDQLLGRAVWGVFPDLVGTEVETVFRHAMDEGVAGSLPEFHFDPMDRWFEVRVTPSEDGVAVAFRDVTRQRADRTALQERMKEAEALAAISRDAATLVDPVDLAALTARRLRTAMVHPPDVGVVISLGEVTSQAGEVADHPRVFQADIVAEGAPRGAIGVHARSGAPLVAEEEALVQTVAETLSLWKQRHRATRALREANERLTEANHALEAAAQLKDDLLSMASHELRTPLTPILGFLELLQTRRDELRGEQRDQLVRIMRAHANRMLRLVDDLLIVSRASAEALESRPEEVSARDVLVPVLEELGDSQPVQDVELAVDGCRLYVDPQHLQQIVLNLLSNAIKYGEPPISIAARPTTPGRVALEVTDRGPGIPEEFRARMWERFEQKDRGDTRTSRGTGLGLSIVKLLADANDGTVGYREGAPRGSIFLVELPGQFA